MGEEGDGGYKVDHMAAPEPMPSWLLRAMALTLIMGLPIWVFLYLFTGFGSGESIMRQLHGMYWISRGFYSIAYMIFAMLYLLDFSYWEGCWKTVKHICISIGVFFFMCGVFTAARMKPANPLAVFYMAVPLFVAFLHKVVFPHVDIAHFLTSMWVSLTFLGCLVTAFWVTWLKHDHSWEDVRDDYALVMGCPNNTLPGMWLNSSCPLEQCLDHQRRHPGVYVQNFTFVENAGGILVHPKYCLGAWLLWCSQMIAGILLFVMGQVVFMLGLSLEHRGGHRLDTGIKFFATICLFCVLAMWVASSIAGANMKMSSAVTTMAGATLMVTGGLLSSVLGFQSLETHILHIPIIQKMGESFMSDYVKAIGVMFFTPVGFMYLCASFCNQKFRLICPFGYEVHPDDRKLCLTKVASVQLKHVKAWNWTSVFSKVQFLGFAYIMMQVGIARLTNVFLAWLNGKLSVVPLPVSTGIFWGVGFSMFMCPVIPGVPVYLAGGVILTAAGEATFGFWKALAYSSVICFFIKLNAVFAQQICIGGGMSGMVSIRQTCGVNSMSIKAIRKVLSAKGITLGKVCILCGGPDWPTSVLTGILKLNPIEMQIGTCPVFFLIMPTCTAGALLLKGSTPPWGSIAGVALAVCGMVQMCAGMAAGYYIEQCAHDCHDELAAIPIDEEVAAADAKVAAKAALMDLVTNWHTALHCPTRSLIFSSMMMMMIAMMLVQMDGPGCFLMFKVTDSIEEKLGGNIMNLVVHPKGWIVVIFFIGSMLLMMYYKQWAKRKAKLMTVAMGGTINPIAEGGEAPQLDADPVHDCYEPIFVMILVIFTCFFLAKQTWQKGSTAAQADAVSGETVRRLLIQGHLSGEASDNAFLRTQEDIPTAFELLASPTHSMLF